MTSVAPETTTDVTAAALGAEPEIEGRTPRQLFWARFRQDKAALVGLGLIVLLLLIAILAGLIAKLVGHGPNDLYQNQTLDQFGLPTGPSSIFTWPYIARIVRGNTLSIREKEFIEASRSLGAGNIRIMFREVLPNLVAPIIVYTTLIIPNNVLFEAGLSFLGLGVPQDTPS